MIGCLMERVQVAAATGGLPSSEILTAVVAVVSVLAGVFVGIFSPVFSSAATRRRGRRVTERETANRILILLGQESDMDELLSLFLKNPGSIRLPLYLEGSRLQDKEARKACLRFVEEAATAKKNEDLDEYCWEALQEVSRVYRENA